MTGATRKLERKITDRESENRKEITRYIVDRKISREEFYVLSV
jgi:hypothetical protein